MTMLAEIAVFVADKAADVLVSLATDQAQMKLHPPDIKQAIRAGLEKVGTWQETLPVADRLFQKCDDKQQRDFLTQVFADGGIAEQLQRPLVGSGEPDVELMQGYLGRVAGDTHTTLTEGQLKPWLQRFCQTYVTKTALFIKYQVARQRYLQQLANWYDDVKFLGISVAGQEDTKSEKLLQIFVMPDVKAREGNRQISSSFSYFSGHGFYGDSTGTSTIAGCDETDDVSIRLLDIFGEDPASNVRNVKTSFRSADLQAEQRELATLLKQEGKTFSASRLLRESRSHCCVLLGAPGSGKTTLMSYFAVALATGVGIDDLGVDENYLPILVRIRDWVQSDQKGLLDYVRAFATENLAVKELPDGFFEHWLETGKALILLDGLDEVANEARRDEVVNQIEVFLQAQSYRDNPAIITSRPAGYKQAYFRTEEFPHYDLLPFDQPKIDQFIENWYDNRFRDQEESQRRQKTLKKALSERDRIQILAKNPLLLTIIALIHRYEAYLPRDRYQLYNRAVETLLTNWDAGKDIDYQWPLQHLKRDAVRRVMEQLAYWIHSEGSVGDDEGGTLIDRDELIEQLGGFIKEETGCKRYEAEKDAERFLECIRSRTGLLNEQGQDRYAFVHKTFQEYLTAEDIRYRQLDDGFQVVIDHIDDYLHDPHWEEVLLLLIAQQPKKRVAQLIPKILDHDTPHEKWLYRNFFFVADCLGENVKLNDASQVDTILSQLVDFLIAESPLIASQLQQRATQCLMNLGETDFQDVALQHVQRQSARIDVVQLQRLRFALGKEAAATAELLKLLDNDETDFKAAVMLGQLGGGSEAIADALMKLLADDDSIVFYAAAFALGLLGNKNEIVVNTLLKRIDDDNKLISLGVAFALEQLGNGEEAVVSALMERLDDDNSVIRSNAVAFLGRLGNNSEVVINALLELLVDDVSDVRSNSVAALGRLGNSSEAVVNALLECLADGVSDVRADAASALGQLGSRSEAVINALLECLSDSQMLVRWRTATALGQLGSNSDAVVDTLLENLADSHMLVRSSVAAALGQLGNNSDAVVDTLLECLVDDDDFVRSEAASHLGQLGINSEVVVNALLDRLTDDDSNVRSKAATALGTLGKQTAKIAPQLADWLEQHQQFDYVSDGINALWSIVTEQA
jgi:HEAT repeat protein